MNYPSQCPGIHPMHSLLSSLSFGKWAQLAIWMEVAIDLNSWFSGLSASRTIHYFRRSNNGVVVTVLALYDPGE